VVGSEFSKFNILDHLSNNLIQVKKVITKLESYYQGISNKDEKSCEFYAKSIEEVQKQIISKIVEEKSQWTTN
jgi:hypothetical protein